MTPDPSRTVLEAIARERCLEATYNRMTVRLAPHILYTRHGELYVDAVTLLRDGNLPREPKLGSFKLTGLVGLTVVEVPFTRSALYDPQLERYRGETVFAVLEQQAA